jgi:hypothetical protein
MCAAQCGFERVFDELHHISELATSAPAPA